jgi:D-psicose/D-tagatose/L-ribulose 3-epimerase
MAHADCVASDTRGDGRGAPFPSARTPEPGRYHLALASDIVAAMFTALPLWSWIATTLAATASPAALPPTVPGVPVGCFTRLEGTGLEDVKAAGFEFAEIGLRNAVALPDAEFDQLVARSKALGLPILAAINFLPPELKVVGPDVDKAKQDEYLARAFARAERLGLKVIVFGSGKSRSYPAGFAPKEAWKQLVEFGKRAARLASKHGLAIGIEPLGPEEASTINKVAEAVDLARSVAHPAFGLVVDYYHLSQAGEDPAVLLKAGKRLRHVRVANPAGRAFPLAATESSYAAFFDALKRIGYRGGIGIEARTGTVTEQGRASAAFLRTMAATVTAQK